MEGIMEKLWMFQNQYQIKRKDLKLICEAYRRQYLMNKPEQELDRAWVGLGVPSEYKSPYFRPLGGTETPRVKNWYLLTLSGIELFENFVDYFPVPQDSKTRSQLNEYFYDIRL